MDFTMIVASVMVVVVAVRDRAPSRGDGRKRRDDKGTPQ